MSEQLELDGSKERVAYDMALTISNTEKTVEEDPSAFRSYFLTLYWQCHKAVHNHSLEKILRKTD